MLLNGTNSHHHLLNNISLKLTSIKNISNIRLESTQDQMVQTNNFDEHLIILEIIAERMIKKLILVVLLIQIKINDEESYRRKKKQLDSAIDSDQQLVS